MKLEEVARRWTTEVDISDEEAANLGIVFTFESPLTDDNIPF